MTWKQSVPWESLAAMATPGATRPRGDREGDRDPGRRRRWRWPGRPGLSLGVAGCQKITTCSPGQGWQTSSLSAGCLRCHRLRAEGDLWEKRQTAPWRGRGLPSLSCRLCSLAKNEVCPGQEACVWEDDGHLIIIKHMCQVIRKKGLMLVQVTLFLLQSLIWILTGGSASS